MRPNKNDYSGLRYAEYFEELEEYADHLEKEIAILSDDSLPFELDDSDVVCYDEDEDEDEYVYERPALNDLQTRLVMGYFCERINDNLTSLWELIGETGVDDE